MTYLVLELPPPPRGLLPNQRLGRHWGSSNRHRALAQLDASTALLEALEQPGVVPVWRGATGIAHIWLHSRRKPDHDNAEGWLKATQDAIAGKLGFNDSHFRWERIEFAWATTAFKENMVIVLKESDDE